MFFETDDSGYWVMCMDRRHGGRVCGDMVDTCGCMDHRRQDYALEHPRHHVSGPYTLGYSEDADIAAQEGRRLQPHLPLRIMPKGHVFRYTCSQNLDSVLFAACDLSGVDRCGMVVRVTDSTSLIH